MEQAMSRYLDHAVLKPEFTQEDARREILVGVEYAVRTVCVRPCDIALAHELCKGSRTAVGCVLAFPHGMALPQSKQDEAKLYADLGVAEVDMVANYGLIRSEAWQRVEQDIVAVAEVTRAAGIILKVILETGALSADQIRKSTVIAADAGADFVKTSTGFGEGSATEEAVGAMLDAAGDRIAVKASGGIRDRARAEAFITMGCKRLGVGSTSTPVLCGDTAKSAENTDAY